ncbi:MAG: hypothetical protein KDD38_10340, partial [Bdellovibrionales bacterium]|nr:hypothetical protein [Bdellovibrionales bacterium]
MRKLMIPLLLGLALWRPQYALSKNTESTSEWSEQQYRRSLETILNNIQYSIDHLGAESGAIIASIGHAIDDVSKEKQNYNYHWVRDAAIVMQSFV